MTDNERDNVGDSDRDVWPTSPTDTADPAALAEPADASAPSTRPGDPAGDAAGERSGSRTSTGTASRTATGGSGAGSRRAGGSSGAAASGAAPGGAAATAGSVIRRIRDLLASAVLTVAVLAAVVLALGAVLTALGANPENAIVSTVRELGGRLDGPFADLFTFAGEPGKQLLVNWGIAALAYLIAGRVLERVLRP